MHLPQSGIPRQRGGAGNEDCTARLQAPPSRLRDCRCASAHADNDCAHGERVGRGARQKVRGAIVDAVRPAEPRLPARGLWDGGDPSAREGDAIGRLHSELPHGST